MVKKIAEKKPEVELAAVVPSVPVRAAKKVAVKAKRVASKPRVAAPKVAAKPVKKAVVPVKKAPQPKASPKEKIKKAKLVRDSFTMPELEYQALGDVKKACLKAGIAVKKSELLRVGVALVKGLDVAKLKVAIAALAPLKAGRPKTEK